MNLYIVRDYVAEKNGPTFEAVNDAVAIRATKKMLEQYPPEDFGIYHVGTITETSEGEIIIQSGWRHIDGGQIKFEEFKT